MRTKERDEPYCGVDRDKIADASPQIDTDMFKDFVKMVKDRYRIHKRKDVKKLPKPWTTNPIMRQYKFTNVRREHDRETRWLLDNIVNNPEVSYEDKLLNCVLFRIFNKHQTSEVIKQPINFKQLHKNPNRYKQALNTAKSSGLSLFTSAFYTTGARQGIQKYLISQGRSSDLSGNDILVFMDCLYQDGFTDKIKAAKNQQEVFQTITSYTGIGPFLGYQMFVDLTYIPEFPFSENEFTIAGPGCRKGLDLLFTDRTGLTYEECLFWLRDSWETLCGDLQIPWDADMLFSDLPKYDRCMNVMSLENCFCEFSKYMRAKTGQGRPKVRYQGV